MFSDGFKVRQGVAAQRHLYCLLCHQQYHQGVVSNQILDFL